MFGSLNNSFSSLFFTSTKSDKMNDPNHMCSDENEECTGEKYAASNLTCYRCSRQKYLECISDRTEIASILNALNIVQTIDNKEKTRNEITVKLQSIFFRDSMIEFVCKSCKNTEINMKKTHEELVKKLNKKITKLDQEKKQLECKLKQNNNEDIQCVDCTSMISENASLKQEISELKKNEKTDECLKCRELYTENLQLGEKVSSLTNELCELGEKVTSLTKELSKDDTKNTKNDEFSGSIGMIANDIEQLLDAQNELIQQIESNRCEATDKLRSLNHCISNRNAGVIHVAGDTNANNQHLNPNSGTFHPRGNTADIQNNVKSVPLIKPVVLRDANGNFLAPNIPNVNAQSNNLDGNNKFLCIYVGQFVTGIQSDDIVAHIVDKTEINPDLFCVEKLVGPNEDVKRKTFVSFKISTFSTKVYDLIIDDKVWGPNQSARPFNMRTTKSIPKINNMQNKQNQRFGYNFRPNNMNHEYRVHQSNDRHSHRQNENNLRDSDRMRYDSRQKRYIPPPRFNRRNEHRQIQYRNNNSDSNENQNQRRYNPFRMNRDDYEHRQPQYYNNNPSNFAANNYGHQKNRATNDTRSQSGYTPNNNNNNDQSYGQSQQHGQRQSNQSDFLYANGDWNQPQHHQLRMSHNDRQYGSMQSVYRP